MTCIRTMIAAVLLAGWLNHSIAHISYPWIVSGRPVVAAPFQTPGCSALTLTLHPGLQPAVPGRITPPIARDIPRRRFAVRLPIYPGAVRITRYVGTPYVEAPASPYLQSASAEWTIDGNDAVIERSLARDVLACGWRTDGSWNGNAGVFNNGLFFRSRTDRNLTLQIGLAGQPGGTYVSYDVQEITLPKRPASSYLHGPFVQLRIALRLGRNERGQPDPTWHVAHLVVTGRRSIAQLVAAINTIRGYWTEAGFCTEGGGNLTGPAWLAFVRRDGSAVHAFDVGPSCDRGLAVNGTRWMTDRGPILRQIRSLMTGAG